MAENSWINIVNKIGSGFSILGSILSILVCFRYKKLKNFSLELILNLSINTLISGIPAFFPYNENVDFMCKFQALMIIFTDFSQLIWIFIIGYTGLIIMKDNINFELNISKYRLFFMLGGYSFPVIMCIM